MSNDSPQKLAQFIITHKYPPPKLEELWRRCLLTADFVAHYTTPEYFTEPFFVSKGPFAVLATLNDEVIAVCTGLHDNRSIKCGLSVRPQVAISRVADRAAAATGILEGLKQEAQRSVVIDVHAWSRIPEMAALGCQETEQSGVVMLDLTVGPDNIFRQFSATRRNDIRKAIKSGVRVDVAESGTDVAAFYDVYCRWASRKGLPIEPWDELEAAVSSTQNRRLFLARFDGRVIAGTIVRYAPGGIMEYSANSSLEEYLRLHPNDLLNWRAIEWACAQGLQQYSLGATHLFLRKFGGCIKPSYRYRLDRSLLRNYTAREIATAAIEQGVGKLTRRLSGSKRRVQ